MYISLREFTHPCVLGDNTVSLQWLIFVANYVACSSSKFNFTNFVLGVEINITC